MPTPRNMILCFDGTGNKFGVENTNVVRLIQSINRDNQRLYYDPGVGTLPEPGWATTIGKKISEVTSLAFGFGVVRDVEQAYRYLMNFWEPDSKVYLFGFSRGAYTARVLAGMLHSLGLLSRGNEDLVPYAMRLYKTTPSPKSTQGEKDEYWKLCNDFRNTFAKVSSDAERRFPVHFLGLWDTVSSVGWAWEPQTFTYTKKNPSVRVIRHAVAIDEHRAFFRQNEIDCTENRGQDWKEVWFAGVHCDIGGGYSAEKGGLWLVAFDWMIAEAKRHGLFVEADRLDKVRSQQPNALAQPWAEPANESLKGWWEPLEYYPKKHWSQGATSYRMNKGRPRTIKAGELIHESVVMRVKNCNYQPPNFSAAFIDRLKTLSSPVPETIPYVP